MQDSNQETRDQKLESIAQFFDRCYIPQCLPSANQHDSREAYRTCLRTLDRCCGCTVLLSHLNDDLLSQAMVKLVGQGRSAATANKLLRHIKAIWSFARDRRGIALPSCQIKPYRVDRREPEAWFPEELTRIVEAASRRNGLVGAVQAGCFWKAVVLVQMSTGIRIRTQLALPVDHYDRQRRELLAPSELQKQRRDQWMQLLPSAAEAIEALAPWDRGINRLFGDWPYDKKGRPDVLRAHLKKLLVEAGLYESVKEIPPYKHTWHKFRRSFATQIAASAGKDTARELLGHSCLSVTEGYVDRRQLPRPRHLTIDLLPLNSHH